MKFHILATMWVTERSPVDSAKWGPTGSESCWSGE
jgi:hypothetical protein